MTFDEYENPWSALLETNVGKETKEPVEKINHEIEQFQTNRRKRFAELPEPCRMLEGEHSAHHSALYKPESEYRKYYDDWLNKKMIENGALEMDDDELR